MYPRQRCNMRHCPLPPTVSCSLLKLVFDVPLAQAFLMEEHETYSVPNSDEEPWAAFPRW